jgi:hypothetical protein
MKDKFKCNPKGNCWCKKIPYRIEVGGDECLEPETLINEIKKKYNLTKEEVERLMLIINEENKNI